MTVKVGVVGVGGMGACHARHLAELPDAELSWVSDPDQTRGEALAGELATRWIAEGLDGLAECDALIVACPDSFHHRYVAAALQRQLPVLCEKPLTVELDDARALMDAEVATGRRLVQLGFMRVYDERHLQVAEALAGLGAVSRIRSVHRNANLSARSLRDQLVQSVIHDVHTVRWLTGSEIVSLYTAPVWRGERVVHLVVTAKLASGAVAVLEFDDAAAGYEVSVEVAAEGGQVNSAEPLRALIRSGGRIGSEIGDDWFAPFIDTYRRELVDFVGSVVAGVPRGPTIFDGVAAQMVLEAAIESADCDVPVSVELGPKPDLYA